VIRAARRGRRLFGSSGVSLLLVAALASAGRAQAAAGAPVLFQSAPGRFEVAAADVEAARAVVAAAGEAWDALTPALGLPEAFASPVYVRVMPAGAWAGPVAFHVWAEPGGVVSLRMRAASPPAEIRRAIVEALLTRLAIWHHGAASARTVPRWLVEGAVSRWETQVDPARLDLLQQETATMAPPPLEAVLSWRDDDADSRRLRAGAGWLVRFLAEEGEGGEWTACRDHLLAGMESSRALAMSYPGRFAEAGERELWWQVGWHAQQRARTLPLWDAADSRAAIADAVRIVMSREGRDVVVAPPDWPALARSPAGRAEIARRTRALEKRAAIWHPFYRNAALSLGRLLQQAGAGEAGAFATALAAFDTDWRAGAELEAASARALEAFEAQRGPGR
jgi:hypothetical protein